MARALGFWLPILRIARHTGQAGFILKAGIVAWLFACGSAMAAPPPFLFEDGLDTWQPRASSVKVNRVEERGATPGSKACLRIQGRIEPGWNYALSGRFPIQPGKLYQLSAWVRVDKLGADTPPPYLKCEFIGDDPKKPPGQLSTERYDSARLGQWQELKAEFKGPEAAQQAWLALEKGTSKPAEVDARLDTITLEIIPRLSVIEQYRLKPTPPLEKMRGRHPRIYLEAAGVARLRQAVRTTHAGVWREVREQADRYVRSGPPAYREQDGYSGDEQLWQRGVGNAMPVLAMAWLVSGERPYLEAAQKWALASCGYKTWGLGRIDGMDLAAGHQLFGLSMVYDWCFADLDEAARRTIRETLVRRSSAMFEAAATDKAWWRRSYLQNHLWVNVCGLAMAGLALFDEVEDASLWIGLALDKFQKTMAALGPDGASHEGVGYWEYGVEYLLKFMDPARALLGCNLHDHDWWRNTARYAQYLALPREAWTRGNCIVDLADCPRGHWYGPDHLLRGLAREFRDSHAQWLAQQIDEADVASAGAPWLNLVWFDPSVAPLPPDRLPTLRHFADMGIVSARSDWSGNESLVVFKCGPFIGHEAVQSFTYDPGGGHVHPDANHFVVFGQGEWLVRDDGYRGKETGQHNTLLVDGSGQLGEGKMWFDGSQTLRRKARPKILRAESAATFDHFAGDATAAYPPELGLRRFVRHLIFLKPDVLIVCDDIETSQTRDLELRFHPEPIKFERKDQAILFTARKTLLQVTPLTTEGVKVEAANVTAADRHGAKSESMLTVRLTRQTSAWRNAVAFAWGKTGDPIPAILLKRDGDTWSLQKGGQTVTLNWRTARCEGTP